MTERPVIIWGAGRIGRGFVAEVFNAPGYRLAFVDILKPLVQKLHEAGGYTIYKTQGRGIASCRIEGYDAFHIDDAAAILEKMRAHQPIVSAAVQASMLDSLAEMLAPYLRMRAAEMPDDPIDILLSVNKMAPDRAFYEALRRIFAGDAPALRYVEQKVGLVVTVVMRIVPATPDAYLACDPLSLFTNGYPELVADGKAFRGEAPILPMLRLTDDILAEEVRKIYTLNMVHAVACYLGAPRGMIDASEAARDHALRPLLKAALNEAAIGLGGEYGFSEKDMAAWNRLILSLLENPHISDDLARLGADARRKLAGDDRLVGAARLCLKHGGAPKVLAKAIRAGYAYGGDDEGTRAVRQCVLEKGLPEALKVISGLTSDDPLYNMILES